MNYESELINAIIESKDIKLALASRIDHVFETYRDEWTWIKKYYDKYSQIPDRAKIKREFPGFDFVKTEGSLQYYIDEAHKATAAADIKASIAAMVNDYKTDPYRAAQRLAAQMNQIIKESGAVKDIDLVGDANERVDVLRERVQRNENGETVLGIPTGIEPIDVHFGGGQPGDQITIMAASGMGKSWLARLIAARAWLYGYRPLVISMEMNKEQEGYRLDTILNQGANFRNSQISHGRNIDPEEYSTWVKETFDGKHPFYLVTNEGMEACDQSVIEAKVMQFKPDLVIIDYIGLLDEASGITSETDKIRTLSKAFKRMAVKYQIPFYTVTQVTMKDDENMKRAPHLNEIAWSKSLGFDSDLVLSMFREEHTNDFQILGIKNRRGEKFAFILNWDLDTGKVTPKYDATGDWD